MIQRIQTLFLLGAAGLLFSMFFSNMFITAGVTLPDGTTEQEALRYVNDYTCLCLIAGSFVLSCITIFSFKNRFRQIRLCNLNTLILIGFQIFLGVKFFSREPDMIFSVTAVFPICAAILTFIAMRYVARDEAMVLAASRLRKK